MISDGGCSSAHLPAGAAGRLTFNHILRTAVLPAGWRRHARTTRLTWRRMTHPVAELCMAAWLTGRYGPAVARECGESVAAQIRHQVQLMFGDGINPKIYYFLELYRTWSPTVRQQCVMRREIKYGLLMALHRRRLRLDVA